MFSSFTPFNAPLSQLSIIHYPFSIQLPPSRCSLLLSICHYQCLLQYWTGSEARIRFCSQREPDKENAHQFYSLPPTSGLGSHASFFADFRRVFLIRKPCLSQNHPRFFRRLHDRALGCQRRDSRHASHLDRPINRRLYLDWHPLRRRSI